MLRLRGYASDFVNGVVLEVEHNTKSCRATLS